MELNPYTSPVPSAGERSTFGIALLRVLAIGCWITSLLPILGFLSIINHPGVVARRELHFPLFVAMNIIIFALPSLGFILLGFASWRRSLWFLVSGIVAFVPIVLCTLAAALHSI